MERADEDDLKLLRASTGLQTDLKVLLKRILWKTSKDTNQIIVHRLVRTRDLDRTIARVRQYYFLGAPVSHLDLD